MNKIKDLKTGIIFPNSHPYSKWDKKSWELFSNLSEKEMEQLLERIEYVSMCIRGEIKFRAKQAKSEEEQKE